MSEHEGVIQFRLTFTPAPPEQVEGLAEILGWRRVLRILGLLGQDPARYGGLGFGNVSLRRPTPVGAAGRPAFVITGSQTGHLDTLGAAHFATVTGWDIDRNRVEARGPVRPSSETLTHAAVYQVEGGAQCVIHAHSPEIWRHAHRLALPRTAVSASYGTPGMAREVQAIVRAKPAEPVLVMQGHQDGVIAWGATADDAGVALVATLARAFRL